jgi:hypothetical protein
MPYEGVDSLFVDRQSPTTCSALTQLGMSAIIIKPIFACCGKAADHIQSYLWPIPLV